MLAALIRPVGHHLANRNLWTDIRLDPRYRISGQAARYSTQVLDAIDARPPPANKM